METQTVGESWFGHCQRRNIHIRYADDLMLYARSLQDLVVQIACWPNFGKQFAERVPLFVSALLCYVIRHGKVRMYLHSGANLRSQRFSKKGDATLCDSYRPILFLAVGYYLFAAITFPKLKSAGAETRIWNTQFGVRSQKGCAEAIFIARRRWNNPGLESNIL